jgi:predicted MFS family arabinose efflux permease
VPGVRSRTLAPVYLTHAMVHLAIGLFPAVLIVLRTQFDTSYALLGGVFAAAMFVYGFGALPVGLVLHRVSPLLLVRLSLGGITLMLLAIAISPNRAWFAAALLLLGIACAPYHTAALTLVSRVSDNDPRFIGHHGMWGNIGLAGAPTFGALLAWAVSWRLPFACAAGLGALLLVPLCTRLPAMATGADLGDGERERTGPTAGAAGGGTGGHDRPVPPGADDRTDRPALVLVLAITSALGFVYRGFATYLPALTAQRADLIPASALVAGGLLATLVYATGFFGQWWGGHLGGRRRALWIYAGLLTAAAALLAAAFFVVDVALIALLAAFSFTHFCTQPMDNTFTGRFTSQRRRGIGYGLSFGLSFGVGSLAAWLCGRAADAAGGELQYVLLPLSAASLVAALMAVGLALVVRRRTA